MTTLTIELPENEYRHLQNIANNTGKSVKTLIEEWVAQFPIDTETFDVKKDPLFTIEGHDSLAPENYSQQIDKYLYREKILR